MNIRLQILLIVGSLLFTGVIINMVRKELLDLKYSMIWILTGVSLIMFAIWPALVFKLTSFIGIIIPQNAIFLFAIFFLLLISFSMTVALSRQSVRIRKMAQRIALMDNEIYHIKCEYKNSSLKIKE